MVPLDLEQHLLRVPWYQTALSPLTPIDLEIPAILTLRNHGPQSELNMQPLEDLSQEIYTLFGAPCHTARMIDMSGRIKNQFYEKLKSSHACMLPSFCHTLPSGQETGTFVAMDVGGSTLRVALVQLNTRFGADEPVKIQRMTSCKIDERIRGFPADQFFAWMAGQIQGLVKDQPQLTCSDQRVIPIGIAWSFPIEQTSSRGGKVQGMGKGFKCHGSVGQDLGDLIETACRKLGFHVRVDAIVNDSSAVLLSQAYVDQATSMGLILGTGTNAAAFLPVSCMGKTNLGTRDQSWHDKADRVITNTELSMFGKGILPETRWDEELNRQHQIPDFQPLEYMTTGRYLGEILRLVIVEAVENCGLFGGQLPLCLQDAYSLDTTLLAVVESDHSQNMSSSASELQSALDMSQPPSVFEMAFLRSVVEAISHRAAAYLAVAIHALWTLQKETEVNLTTPFGTPKTSIACNGSVILKYPGFRARCEKYIEQMVSTRSAGGLFQVEEIVLQPTNEAAIIGAAVAVAMSR